MSSTLFIRADAGPGIGTGHFMRMLALGERWVERGGSAVFGGEVHSTLIPRSTAIGARFVPIDKHAGDAEWTVLHARLAGATTVVADGYQFDLQFQKHVRAAGLKLMVVDYNGENGSYDANWVLNLNAHASAQMYARRSPDCQLLLGMRYVLLRSSIRKHAKAAWPKLAARRVLVTFGGADPVDATGLVLGALQAPEVRVLVGAANPRVDAYRAEYPKVEFLVDETDVAPVMAWADVALCAPSTTFWELAFLGVPSLVLTLADNQVAIGQKLYDLNALRLMGDARKAPPSHVLAMLMSEFLTNTADRAAVVKAARTLSDGEGTDRVIDAIGLSVSAL